MIDSNKKMMPSDAPPSVLPSKNNSNNVQNKSNYPEIKLCLYKYTYIWQYNGKSYWAYLTCINKCYVYGFKWADCYWIPLKVKLCEIESFVCY